jgi:PAS domain S-box-containing protein
LPAQLWVAFRYLESLSLLVAALLIGKRFSPAVAFISYSLVTTAVAIAIFFGAFPDCFVEGKGLTTFKIGSEYVIAGLFLASILLLMRNRRSFDRNVLSLLVLSLAVAVGAEIAFTQFVSLYGPANAIGHYLLLLSSYCLYRAVLVTGIVKPFSLLFRDLKQKEEELEVRVADRTRALAQSEERFRVLVEQAPEAIVVFDVELDHIVDANANAEKLFGCGRDELRKHGPQHFYPPGQPDERPVMETFREYTERALAGKPMVLKRAIRSAEGKDFLCEVRLNRLPSADRKLVRASFIDITERKQAEEALRKSEARLKLQFDRMPVACIAWDTEFRVLSWNPAAEKIFGFTASEAIGKHPYEFFVPKAAQPQVDAVWSRLLQGDATAHSVNENVTKDGRTIICDWTNTPLTEADGGVAGALSMTQDVTELKQAEQDRLAHLRFLESMDRVNRAMQGTNDLDRMMRDVLGVVLAIFDCDRAWLFYPCDHDATSFRVPMEITRPGYPGADILNVDVPLPRDMAQNLREALESADPVTYAAGTEKPVNKVSAEQFGVKAMMLTALYPKSGKPWAFGIHQCSYARTWTSEELRLFQEIGRRLADGLSSLLFFRDLSKEREHLEELVAVRTAELTRANGGLESANRELEAFAYSVSHDLRVPLRAIDGFSRILLEDYSGKLDAEGQRVLNVVRDNAVKMARLIDDILAFSRAGRSEIAAAPIDMDGTVRAVVEELEPAAAGRKLTFDIKPLAPARGDAAMVQRVWTNLIDNAIKFTAPRPDAVIEIGSTAGEKETTYYVKDNGAGFDMQYAGKLFGVFQRLHGSEFAGTGIGLAIVKRIVARHGGRVWAEGKVNEGATFYFTLPVQEDSHA